MNDGWMLLAGIACVVPSAWLIVYLHRRLVRGARRVVDGRLFRILTGRRQRANYELRIATALAPPLLFRLQPRGLWSTWPNVAAPPFGAERFDQCWRLDSDDPKLRLLCHDDTALSTALEAMAKSAEQADGQMDGLRAQHGHLVADFSTRGPVPERLIFAAISALGAAAKVLETLPTEPLSRRDKYPPRIAFVRTAIYGLLALGTYGLLRTKFDRPRLLDAGALWLTTLPASAMLFVFGWALAWWLLRGSTRWTRLRWEWLLLGSVAAVAGGYGGGRLLNLHADVAPAEHYQQPALLRSFKSEGRSRRMSYGLETADFTRASDTLMLYLSVSAYSQLGGTRRDANTRTPIIVRIKVRRGALHHPWIESIERVSTP